MEDFNWKKIKDIMSKYAGSLPDKDPAKITPIFAHASVDNVKVNFSGIFSHFFSAVSDDDDRYSYVVSLFKKHDNFHVKNRAFLITSAGEAPILNEEKVFKKNEFKSKEFMYYVRQPLHLFVKGKDIRVMTFKDSDMTEESLEDLIELWRTQQI